MSTVTAAQRQIFKGAKEAPALVIFLIFISEIGLNWLYVNFLHAAFTVPATLTNGLIQPLFTLSFLKVAFIILGVAFWIGKFTHLHLGLSAINLRIGLISTFFFWCLLQICAISVSALLPGGINFLAGQSMQNPLPLMVTFVLFAASKAFYDEVIYRGLVLPQLLIKARRFIDLPSQVTLAIAVVISQVIYLVIQMPLISLVSTDDTHLPVVFFSLFVLSILNALVYLRTKNIFLSVGIHTLWFYPLFIVRTPAQPEYFLAIIALGLIAIWPMLPKQAHIKQSWPTQNQRFS